MYIVNTKREELLTKIFMIASLVKSLENVFQTSIKKNKLFLLCVSTNLNKKDKEKIFVERKATLIDLVK